MKRRGLDNIAMTIGQTIVVAMGLGLTLQQLADAGLGLVGFPQWKNPLYYETRFYMVLLPAKVTALVESLDAIPAADQAAVITAAHAPRSESRFCRSLETTLSASREPCSTSTPWSKAFVRTLLTLAWR